jgi:peptide-methionine (R)-S-oxide reductase
MNEIKKKELAENLTDEEKKVLLEYGTEIPFSGEYVEEKSQGTYNCKLCGNPLFKSDAKFNSGTGWPSFDQVIEGSVNYNEDNSNGMSRNEISCAKCGGHLGHVFPDGPKETTGERFCINSVCLNLEKKD